MNNSIYQKLILANSEALKKKDTKTRSIVSTVIAESSKTEKIPDNSTVIKVLKKMIASNVSVINLLKPTDVRRIIFEQENDTMNTFLPRQLNKDEIREIIRENNLISLPQTMMWFKTNYADRYDPSFIKEILM